ncbi:MAG TPA: hypothetical protein VF816_04460 [Rhodocyclaceae bacterium]
MTVPRTSNLGNRGRNVAGWRCPLFLLGLAVSGASLAETCVNMQFVEACMESEAVERAINPAKLREVITAGRPALQAGSPVASRIIRNYPVRSLSIRWNRVAAEVLGSPTDRSAYYQAIFGGMSQQKLFKISIETRPALRVSGLPDKPRARFDADGLSDMYGVVVGTELPQEDARQLVAVLNSALQAQGDRAQFQTVNIVPFLAEFLYQLRLVYSDLDKQVVVFDDSSGPASSWVDQAGTLYLPKSMLRLDRSELDLVLAHEAIHLTLPPASQLLSWLMPLGPSMGPMGNVLKSREVADRRKFLNLDVETDVDAGVLEHFAAQPDQRRRYQAMIQRLEPDSQRGAIIAYLNRHLDAGDWPRPPVRLGLHQAAPLFDAMLKYEAMSDPADKSKALMRLFDVFPTVLPKEEREFYEPLFRQLMKHYQDRPDRLAAGTGRRYLPSELEGVGAMFREVLAK